MKRLPTLLLVLSALLLLGGCAIEPAYRYNANGGGGYYTGQSAYGNANTVIEGSVYASPWGYPGWGYGYAPGWWGYGGFGFGATYVYRPHYRGHRHDYRRGHAWRDSSHHDWRHAGGHHRSRHSTRSTRSHPQR